MWSLAEMRMISGNSNLTRESRSIQRKDALNTCSRYPSESYVRYLNNATVQAAIGAFVNYTEQSVAVAGAFNSTGDDGRLDGTTTDVLALVEQGVSVNTALSRITAIAYMRTGHNDIRRRRLQ